MIKKEFKEDLDTYFKLYENKHIYPYYSVSKEEINKFIEEYTSKNDVLNKYDFAYLLKLIMKKLSNRKDTHMFMNYECGKFLPIICEYIEGGFVIVYTSDKYKKYIGHRIKSVNNVPIEKLQKEAESIINYATTMKLYGELPSYIAGGDSRLKTLPSIDSSCTQLTYELDNGTITFDINETKDEELPSYKLRQERLNNNCTYKIIDDTLIFDYTMCRENHEGQMEESVNKVKRVIKENKIRNFVLDLRKNDGGNSNIIKPLTSYLKDSKLNLYAFVSRRTFSAGIWAACDMKELGAKIIGEEVGDTLNSFGNVIVEKLPNSGYSVSCSYRYFAITPENLIVLKTKEEVGKNKDLIDKEYHLDLDYIVDKKIDDIINNKDPYMNIYNKIKEGEKNGYADSSISRKTKRR